MLKTISSTLNDIRATMTLYVDSAANGKITEESAARFLKALNIRMHKAGHLDEDETVSQKYPDELLAALDKSYSAKDNNFSLDFGDTEQGKHNRAVFNLHKPPVSSDTISTEAA